MPGVLACVYTTSAYQEGSSSAGGDQHIAIKRSTDGGATWGSEIDVEPSSSNTASWGMPYYDADNDKLYVFYTYNIDGLTSTDKVGGGTTVRVDVVGTLSYRTSDDKGLTWSARTDLSLPSSNIDSRNAYSGAKQFFWMQDVKAANGKVYLSINKAADAGLTDTEGFFAEIDIPPTTVNLLPSGGDGLRADDTFGSTTITEETSAIFHSDGLISAFARTDKGRLTEFWSTDGGATFTADWARLSDGTSYVPHPRASPFVCELPDGRFFLWTYNKYGTTFSGADRDPVWYRIGVRSGNRILWGVHHMLTFTATQNGIAYPSLVIDGTNVLIAASDKGTVSGLYGAKLLTFDLSDF